VIRPSAACVAVLTALTVVPLGARSQTPPPASPSPAPTSSPNPIGPALGNNDPCTSLSSIVTRPSVTNSVCTVRPNHLDVETGYFNSSGASGGNSVTYPQTLIRIGTKIPALELQIAPPQVERVSGGGAVVTGSTDVGAGLKYVFGYSPKFNWGGQAFFTVPTGTNGFSAGGTNATYALNAGYTITPVFSLATTLATNSLTNGAERWSSFVPSLVLGASLPGSSGAFVEIATFSNANGPASATRTQYLYGLYKDLTPRLQVDVSSALSPTVATGKYHGIGFGLSYYF